MQHLSEYINRKGPLDAASMTHLRTLVERYPYYHAARIIYLRALHAAHDAQFSKELRLAAISVPSRKTLYDLIEGDNLKPQGKAAKAKPQSLADKNSAEETPDRTGSLIDGFLSQIPEEKPTKRPRIVDVHTNYLDYMMSLEMDKLDTPEDNQSPAVEIPSMRSQALIDDYLSAGIDGKIKLEERSDEEMEKPRLGDENDTQGGVCTETLARIYIKQGKYDKAIEIISRLSLKYPKKNRYFADQIRFLEKLVLNNKNK